MGRDEVLRTASSIAREWGLRVHEVATVIRASGVDFMATGNSWLLTPEQVREIEPQLRRLKQPKPRDVTLAREA
jgi:hypothetical protein